MSFTMTKNKITLTKGDTFSIPIDFHQPIEGATITIQIYALDGLVPLITKEIKEHTNAGAGKSLLHLEKEMTDLQAGSYKIEMFITFLNGTKYTFYPPLPEIKTTLEIIPSI